MTAPARKGAGRRVVQRALKRVYGPLSGFPFESRSERRLLIHCTHHKVGTVWFKNVLSRVAALYGLSFQTTREGKPIPHVGLVLANGSAMDFATLPPYRGTHIIRDPRDIVISSYFYHRRCSEKWVLEPQERFDGRSYQQVLQSLDEADGITAEMRYGHAPRTVTRMADWDYNRPEFLELRYEQFIADEIGHWQRVFAHYGFRDSAVRRSARLAAIYSISSPDYRARRSSHVRSGKAGDWRAYFNDRHREQFHETCGDALIRLGYERDDRW